MSASAARPKLKSQVALNSRPSRSKEACRQRQDEQESYSNHTPRGGAEEEPYGRSGRDVPAWSTSLVLAEATEDREAPLERDAKGALKEGPRRDTRENAQADVYEHGTAA